MIKRMKEFDEHTKEKYGDNMSIPKDQSLSSNMYPEHYDKPSNADSGEMEGIYVL